MDRRKERSKTQTRDRENNNVSIRNTNSTAPNQQKTDELEASSGKNEPYDPLRSVQDFHCFLNSRIQKGMDVAEKVIKRLENLFELANNTINAELEVHIGRVDKHNEKK